MAFDGMGLVRDLDFRYAHGLTRFEKISTQTLATIR
jgi:hypothetical protein